MMCFRNRTSCNAPGCCSRFNHRLDEAVHGAATPSCEGQREPVPLSSADCSAQCPNFVPDVRA